GIDAGENGALGAFVAVGVRGGFAAQRVSLVDDGVQFFLSELRGVHIVGERMDAARRAHLNYVGAILVIEPHGVTSLIRPVDDTVQGIALFSEKPLAETAAMVAMAACRAKRVYSDEHAGA